MAEFDKFDLEVLKDCINNKHHQIMCDIQDPINPPDRLELMELEMELSELARVYEKLHEQMYGEKVIITLS